jgi:hypothetical protein
VYLLPVNDISRYGVRLRLRPTRNNQKRGIRYAADYEIDRWTTEALRELVSPSESEASKAIVA